MLTVIYEKQFSENSFGFRPNRGARDTLIQYQVNGKDGRVISLIHKYLNAGVFSRRIFEKTEVGMPQGGPLSSLLSNIMPYIEDKLFQQICYIKQ